MDGRRDSNRLVWGLVLLSVGLIFLLSNFGFVPPGLWGRWWPLILIAIGLIILLRRSEPAAPPEPLEAPFGATPSEAPAPPLSAGTERRRDFPTGAVILIGLGLAFLLQDVIGGSAFPALVLIVIGAALLLRDWNRRSK